MNKIILLFLFVLFVQNTFAQNISQSNAPSIVLNAFQLKFPNADDIKWKLDKGNYKIEYKVNSKSNKLTIDYKGNILKHAQDLYVSEIPKIVLETIKARVEYFDILDADKNEKGNKIAYEIKFKNDGKYRYFWINEKGELLKYRKELKDSELPSSIINLISNKYGKIDIDYSKYVEEGNKIIYIIRGEINGTYNDFTIDDKTTILKHSLDIKNNEIPNAILKTITSKYKHYQIQDADLIEEKGNTIYILRMKKSKNQVYVTFNKSGKVLHVK